MMADRGFGFFELLKNQWSQQHFSFNYKPVHKLEYFKSTSIKIHAQIIHEKSKT